MKPMGGPHCAWASGGARLRVHCLHSPHPCALGAPRNSLKSLPETQGKKNPNQFTCISTAPKRVFKEKKEDVLLWLSLAQVCHTDLTALHMRSWQSTEPREGPQRCAHDTAQHSQISRDTEGL